MLMKIILTEVSKPVGISLEFANKEYFIHPGIFYSYVIALFICLFCILVAYKVKRADPSKRPKGLVFFAEYFVTSINNFTKQNLSEGRRSLAPYLGMLAMYLLISNLSGLLSFVPPTSDFNVTLTLALITIVMAQIYGIKVDGVKNYFRSFTEPYVFLLPNNLLDLITTPLSMALRLFGNVLAGAIIMSLVYNALGFISVLVAPVFHAYFDVFAGGIQTFVFVLLTAVTVEK
ncbi:MAG: F0F1 ATP synthase subunit A [Bacilli bacterium]